MKNKLLCKLLILGLVSSSIAGFSTVKANAAELSTVQAKLVTAEQKQVSPMTIYDWWVYNLGVNAWGVSQIMGPMSGGHFNTESAWGSDRTFTISWSGASSNAEFYIKSVGQDAGNSGTVNYSGYCTGSSGSTTLTIPYEDRGIINLYVDSYTSTTINISSIHVTN
ncbi:hypothetical protein OSC52_20000 [Clostridium pasteurianum]|uniref:hypothetical protein n=1 Tax=Clostridium pasteurianum TaxID=1501 RepID=UPI002260F541|nr:hypothetical protein [Clostridium pasteurianum]UZW14062.1 hypothetical protein OSC52_20000 [Clostridium pasteurianum]